MIIAICGLMGCGKNIVADYIAEKYDCNIIDYADKLREICRKEGLEVTRDNLQKLRLRRGNTFLAEAVVEEVKKSKAKNFVLTPIRRSEDFTIVKREFPEAKLLLIESSEQARFERLKERGRENDPKDITEFRRQEKREFEIFNFAETFALADFKIKNSGSIEEMKSHINKIMKSIVKK